jgi:hypothetical protein
VGWSLDYRFPEEPERVNKFFKSVGKALYVATAFEWKCRYVLRVAKAVHHYQETNDGAAMLALLQTAKDKMLAPTLGELQRFPIVEPDDVQVLERAKDARNFIAHEGAGIGPVATASARTISEQTKRLRCEVANLVAGDNIVSAWIYEIEEKEGAPREIQRLYPGWVDRWVFEDKWHVVKVHNDFAEFLKARTKRT